MPIVGGEEALSGLLGPLAAFEWATPLPKAAEPFPADLDSPGLPLLLHLLLPGETIGTSVPRPAQPGLLGVLPGRAPPADQPPEPGSFEPEDAPDAVPVDAAGMPLDAPAEWVAPWAAKMDQRLAP